jgi:hypothetical protein
MGLAEGATLVLNGVYQFRLSYGAGKRVSLTSLNGKPPATISLASSLNPSSQGQSVTFSASFSGSFGVPTGVATFLDGTTVLGSSPISAGNASFSTASLAPGNHPVTVAYAGDTNYGGGVSAPLTQVVNAGLSVPGAPSITAVVGGYPTTRVSFMPPASDGGSPIMSYTATATPGAYTASCVAPCSDILFTGLSPGTTYFFAVAATNAVGSGPYSPALSATIPQSTATVTFTTSPNPSTSGQSVTFTATVAGSPVPTGTVTFTDAFAPIPGCPPVTLSGGQAQCVTSAMATGTHDLRAQYSGDATYSAVTTPIQVHSVTAAKVTPVVTLTSSTNPSFPNQLVQFTVSVVASPTATGTVIVKDGGTAINVCNSIALSGGLMQCSVGS